MQIDLEVPEDSGNLPNPMTSIVGICLFHRENTMLHRELLYKSRAAAAAPMKAIAPDVANGAAPAVEIGGDGFADVMEEVADVVA